MKQPVDKTVDETTCQFNKSLTKQKVFVTQLLGKTASL